MTKFHGITYPSRLSYDWTLRLWKKFCCSRNQHLFDEVLSSDHYLVCDACQLMVWIDKIDTSYVD